MVCDKVGVVVAWVVDVVDGRFLVYGCGRGFVAIVCATGIDADVFGRDEQGSAGRGDKRAGELQNLGARA